MCSYLEKLKITNQNINIPQFINERVAVERTGEDITN